MVLGIIWNSSVLSFGIDWENICIKWFCIIKIGRIDSWSRHRMFCWNIYRHIVEYACLSLMARSSRREYTCLPMIARSTVQGWWHGNNGSVSSWGGATVIVGSPIPNSRWSSDLNSDRRSAQKRRSNLRRWIWAPRTNNRRILYNCEEDKAEYYPLTSRYARSRNNPGRWSQRTRGERLEFRWLAHWRSQRSVVWELAIREVAKQSWSLELEDTWRAIGISLTWTLEESKEYDTRTRDMRSLEMIWTVRSPKL
jgi:hypothetical protein